MKAAIRIPDLKPGQTPSWICAVQALLLLFIFLVGIRGLGTGFKGLGSDLLDTFFQATSNPFVGLTIGILSTSLVQSSSVTTSMIVALVAAPECPLPIVNAIPMVMGANIGTTVTNSIVALTQIGRPLEYRRAFAAATCHDFFNMLTVTTLLPLELLTGYLRRSSNFIASFVKTGTGPGTLPNPLKSATKATLEPIQDIVRWFSDEPKIQASLLILVSVAIILISLTLIVKTLKVLAATKLQIFINRSLGANAHIGIVIGMIATMMVQSSSITTSIMVPLAAAGIVTLRQIFPIAVGANVGTTITAILASMGTPSETAHLGVQIAMVHLLFNISGMLIFYPIPAMRRIPLAMAERMSRLAYRNRKLTIVYVMGVFYGMPTLLIFLTR